MCQDYYDYYRLLLIVVVVKVFVTSTTIIKVTAQGEPPEGLSGGQARGHQEDRAREGLQGVCYDTIQA